MSPPFETMTAVTDARAFFGEHLPRILAETPERGDALRCRFRISDAGAWDLDLRLPHQRCTPVSLDVREAVPKGVSLAEVELDATTWARLRASRATDLDRWRREGCVVARGDAERGLLLLAAVAQAPPLVWPAGLRASPLDSAFFAASTEDLARAFSGWQPPSTPGERGAETAPLEPPIAYRVFMPGRYWWEVLVEFYLTLVEDEEASRWLEEEDPVADALERVFPVVLQRGEVDVRRVPPKLLPALAALDDAQLAAMRPGAQRWSYEQLRPLARAAATERRDLWFWGHW